MEQYANDKGAGRKVRGPHEAETLLVSRHLMEATNLTVF